MDKLGNNYVYLSIVELLWTQLFSTIVEVEVNNKNTISVYTTSMELYSKIIYLNGYACTTYNKIIYLNGYACTTYLRTYV